MLTECLPPSMPLPWSAWVPLNFLRVQSLIAARPSGRPSVVTARLECMRMPRIVCNRCRPSLFLCPLATLCVRPIACVSLRVNENSVVSCSTRIGPSTAANRACVA